MSELVCLELSVVLWVVHVLIQAGFGTSTLPAGYLVTPRDMPAQPRGAMFGRADPRAGQLRREPCPRSSRSTSGSSSRT